MKSEESSAREKLREQFDVVVVGAGPGGSNACSVALRAGLKVAQIEQLRFPRIKPCAGGMTVKSCRALQFELEPSIRGTFNAFELNYWCNRVNRFSHRLPILRMVLRPEFDNQLVEQNRRFANFSFFDQEKVRGVTYDGSFHVQTERRSLQARQLVGADGAYSLVNRTFGISQPKLLATAVEVNLSRESTSLKQALVPCLDFGVLEKGYGWVFPKDDHWSVGLYTLASGQKDIRGWLVQYIRDKGFETAADPLETFEAHRIPVGGFRLRAPDAPVYIVGDAGGFADAITGEGIYHALESGRLAGEILCRRHSGKTSHRNYYRKLWKNVLLDTFITYQLAGPFYRFLGRSTRALASPLLWRPFVQGYAGGATFSRSLIGLPFYLLKSVQ
ncbi:MAG: NAD(P)/FAD-dependent oxidoreductase [Acidobacteriota bacterium]